MARGAAAGLVLRAAGPAAADDSPSASPSASKSAPPPVQKHGSSTFVVGNTESVDTLNPYVGFTQQDFEVYGMVYDQLMDYKPSPRLATSWSTSADGLT